MEEPIWVDRMMADAIHFDQLRQHGGLPGIKDENALESALSRPRNKWAYEPDSDLTTLAAAYGYGLATNHGYSDGNKRITFAVLYTFLGLNGMEIVAEEVEVVQLMRELASHACDEAELVIWLRAHTLPFEI